MVVSWKEKGPEEGQVVKHGAWGGRMEAGLGQDKYGNGTTAGEEEGRMRGEGQERWRSCRQRTPGVRSIFTGRNIRLDREESRGQDLGELVVSSCVQGFQETDKQKQCKNWEERRKDMQEKEGAM